MAKTIKFNLILDGYPIRTLEDLQEHFSIEDMLKYYQNGLLLRWLDVRGYIKQHDSVVAIKGETKKDIIKALVKIFEIKIRKADVDEAIGILDYLDEQKLLEAVYKENSVSRRQIIDDYHAGYTALVNHMIENSGDMAILKADAIEMEREYLELFRLDHTTLYNRLYENAPKAIYAMLTHDAFRKNWLEDSNGICDHIVKYLATVDALNNHLGEDLKVVNRNTQGMWDQIEKGEVKVMALYIPQNTFVKNLGAFSEKIGYGEINGKFKMFNGLEFQSNVETKMMYMEA